MVIDGIMGFWTEVANASNVVGAQRLLKEEESKDSYIVKMEAYKRRYYKHEQDRVLVCYRYFSILKCYQRIISDERVRQ